jgi:peptidoglycan L-alanyl-D-glutamate endopeptidase CwlK
MSKLTQSQKERTEKNLIGVHRDLVRLVRRATVLSSVGFIISEGVRSQARQRELVKAGASRTLNSRHLTGHAVDVAAVVNGKVSWDYDLYIKISKAFKQASAELNVPIIWGGDWPRFRDGPHYELDRRRYP